MSLKLLYLVCSKGHEIDAMVTKTGESAAIFFMVLSSFSANTVAPTTSELEEMYSTAAQE